MSTDPDDVDTVRAISRVVDLDSPPAGLEERIRFAIAADQAARPSTTQEPTDGR